MLQQTRAAAVIPYYERFLKRFPTVERLARASDAELLECWSGLGYYSRARNLRSAAQQIVRELRGEFPQKFEMWMNLPGVGSYTAAAVASIAFGEAHAVLDGNVARVMARWTAERGDVRSATVREKLRERAQALLDRANPGESNQAMMELGATVCLPRNPLCLVCPVAAWCEARRLGIQEELPVKLGKREPVRERITVALVERDGSLLLRQRPEDASLMPGFWELPQADGDTAPAALIELGEALKRFRHSITYHEYSVTVFRAALRGRRPAGFRWVARSALASLPLTTITRKALKAD